MTVTPATSLSTLLGRGTVGQIKRRRYVKPAGDRADYISPTEQLVISRPMPPSTRTVFCPIDPIEALDACYELACGHLPMEQCKCQA